MVVDTFCPYWIEKPVTLLSGFSCCNQNMAIDFLGKIFICTSLYIRLNDLFLFWKKFMKTHLDLKKRHLFGHEMNLMMISNVNQALQTHSTKKNASCALVWALSKVQADVLKDVRTVMLRITGTRISGWVFRQKETIDTTMKNTEMMPITWKSRWICSLDWFVYSKE